MEATIKTLEKELSDVRKEYNSYLAKKLYLGRTSWEKSPMAKEKRNLYKKLIQKDKELDKLKNG